MDVIKLGPRELYQEDIEDLRLRLVESYPLMAAQLSDEDIDVLFLQIERLLDPFSHGYRNYN